VINKVILIGNLGADPELRYTSSGTPVASLRVATTRRWNEKDGGKKEETEWHRVTVWGKTAEICKEYLAKGRQVYIEGRLQTRSYDDKQGQKRYATDVVAEQVKFLGGKRDGGANEGQQRDEPPAGFGDDSDLPPF